MVNYSQAVAERTKRLMQYNMENESNLPPRTISVNLKKEDDFVSAATRQGSSLTWYSDESKERGGTEKGASPLSYFLSSMGFCQLVHYAEHSLLSGIEVESLEMKIDGKIVMQKPRRFTEVDYEVKIASGNDDENIRKLAKSAAEDCFITNTLKRSIPVRGIIIHNGKQIDVHI